MLILLKYLITIRIRKFFGDADLSAFIAILVVVAIIKKISMYYVEEYPYLFLFFSLGILNYHNNRNDLELLKLYPNARIILYLEYFLYSLPFTLPLLLSFQWLYFLAYQSLIVVYLFAPVLKTRVSKYPFKLFDPFWIMNFRRHKLALLYPLFLFLVFMGHLHSNDNLIIAAMMIVAYMTCVHGFQRESIYHVGISAYQNSSYLLQQIKTSLYNSIFIIVPTVVVIAFVNYRLLAVIPVIVLFMIFNILAKYTFFRSTFQHNFFIAFCMGFFQYAFPLIVIPFIFHKSIKNLRELK